MNQPEQQGNDSPRIAATFAVPATVLAVFGGLLFLLSTALLAVAVSFLSRGPADRSGVLPALGIATIFGCGACFLFAASYRKRLKTFEETGVSQQLTRRRLFWFRLVLLPFFLASAIGTLGNGITFARLVNQEYLHWVNVEQVENWNSEETPLAHMVETGIATIVLLPISLLLCFALFAKPRNRDRLVTSAVADENDVDDNPYSPPQHSESRSIQPSNSLSQNSSGTSTFKPLNAQVLVNREDITVSLRQDRVIVFVSVEWSGPERKGRVTFSEFIDRIRSTMPFINFWILSEHSDCIQEWFDHLNLPPTAATGFGAVVWITNGQAVAVVEHAAELGVEGLVRQTLELWG